MPTIAVVKQSDIIQSIMQTVRGEFRFVRWQVDRMRRKIPPYFFNEFKHLPFNPIRTPLPLGHLSNVSFDYHFIVSGPFGDFEQRIRLIRPVAFAVLGATPEHSRVVQFERILPVARADHFVSESRIRRLFRHLSLAAF